MNIPQSSRSDSIKHCTSKIRTLVDQGIPDPKAILQLGFNLGRLSELSEGGRTRYWDPWKAAVINQDQEALKNLVRLLPEVESSDQPTDINGSSLPDSA